MEFSKIDIVVHMYFSSVSLGALSFPKRHLHVVENPQYHHWNLLAKKLFQFTTG